MARKPRQKSLMNCFHLILRGNNKQIVFECTDDYRFFLSRMGRYTRQYGIRLVAYCLMENHVHLLVYDPENAVSEMMHKLDACYARYYNQKYERVGHLFQGRYLSEPVNDDAYLLTVFRYILNNPVKAGLGSVAHYRWNSYKAFFREDAPLDLDFFHEKFPTPEAYMEFLNTANDDECLDYDRPVHDDEWARGVIQRKLAVKSGTELQTWDRQRRNNALKELKAAGLTIRQIERLTGISHSVVQRVS